ncbi:MAG: aspartate/glutamate racemase family protein [Rectinemataceae bacterium]|nr:aspartate/glutamate racemase family protein [Rectinemataceae bacterium]
MIAKGGYCSYGQDLGILMLDTTFPRLPGDIGNAKSFPFPVCYKRVPGASPKRVVEEADPSLLEPFIAVARELETEGVRAITTSCGFLALFQQELAASVNVPLFSSSLLQIPLLYEIFGRRGKVGVLTARSASLTELHFRNCGVQGIPLAVAGMDEQPEFTRVFLDKSEPGMEPRLDVKRAEAELKNVAAALAAEEPEIRFIVLECTNMPPFKKAIQEASGKPVFDIISLAGFIHSGLLGS